MTHGRKADDYGWNDESPEGSHTYLLPEVLRLLKKETRGELIDIGTGNGALLPHWKASGWSTSSPNRDSDP